MDDRTFDEAISRALRASDSDGTTAANVSRKTQDRREAFWLTVREKMEGFLLPDCRMIADKPEARGRVTLVDHSQQVPASVKLHASGVTFEFRGNFEARRLEIRRTNPLTIRCGELAANLPIEDFTQDAAREWLEAFASEAFRI
jgi:hypothetical protein